MRRMIAALTALVLALTFVGCGKTEEETTTITGMVTGINGTVLSLAEMDSSMDGKNFEGGERPSMPENMEGFENFQGGELPWGEGEMPELPEGQMPERPQDGERPEMPTGEDGQIPEMPTGEDGENAGFTPFGDGERPDFEGGEMPDRGNFEYDGEVTEIDIGSTHISVEEDGVKASGSLSDITVGSFVTITRNAKGAVTNVLVTARTGFGGKGGFRDFGNFEGSKPTEDSEN